MSGLRDGSQSWLAALLLSAPLLARADHGLVVKVDCARGERIERALTLGDPGKPLEVVVDGTCAEAVAVTRSDVTLRAGAAGGAIAGTDAGVDTLLVTGSRVVVEGLSVTGGRDGIVGETAAGLVLRGVSVSGAGRTGILLGRGTSARVEGCASERNGRDGIALDAATAVVLRSRFSENVRLGVAVVNGASARIGLDPLNQPGGNVITRNGSAGLNVALSSSAYVAMTEISANGTDPAAAAGRQGVIVTGSTASLVGGNLIVDNAGTGVFAGRNASVVVGDPGLGFAETRNTVSGNGKADSSGGVFAFLGSTLLVRSATVTGNGGFGLGLSLRSAGQLSASTIARNAGDGVRLLMGGALFPQLPGATSTIADNTGWGVQCFDGESSSVNPSQLVVTGNGQGAFAPACTGY